MMNNSAQSALNSFKKVHIEATVNFAISHIPNADKDTLEKYLELVNIQGNFGSIGEDELLEKMDKLRKYVPDVCEVSLIAVSDLLGIRFPVQTENNKIVGIITPAHHQDNRLQTAWRH